MLHARCCPRIGRLNARAVAPALASRRSSAREPRADRYRARTRETRPARRRPKRCTSGRRRRLHRSQAARAEPWRRTHRAAIARSPGATMRRGCGAPMRRFLPGRRTWRDARRCAYACGFLRSNARADRAATARRQGIARTRRSRASPRARPADRPGLVPAPPGPAPRRMRRRRSRRARMTPWQAGIRTRARRASTPAPPYRRRCKAGRANPGRSSRTARAATRGDRAAICPEWKRSSQRRGRGRRPSKSRPPRGGRAFVAREQAHRWFGSPARSRERCPGSLPTRLPRPE